MSLKNFIFSKVFIKNLGLAMAIVVGAVMLVLIWMNFYTRHGQARPVPDFYGLPLEKAEALARKNKLRYQIIDSVYTNLVPRGSIAEQSPKPGFKVKKWRNIVLTINAFNPEMVAMPNLINLPLRQVSKVLESAGLEMGQRRYKPDVSLNLVLEQYYKGKQIMEGDSVQKGSVIDLVLGKGLSNQLTNVPYLLGLQLDPAKSKIMESSFNLGTFMYDNTITTREDSLKAVVYKQNPDYREGAKPLGSDVYLWLTVDPTKVASDSTTAVTDSVPSAEIVSSIR
ncbi:MAG: PASTA domain-containing protein [Methanosarcina sp.]